MPSTVGQRIDNECAHRKGFQKEFEVFQIFGARTSKIKALISGVP
jgi:hypothetical protein